MYYDIYTDGSTSQQQCKSASAFAVYTNNFLEDTGVRITNSIYVFEAELIAILDAINWVINCEYITEEDHVTISTDSIKSQEAILNILNNKEVESFHYETVDKLEEAIKRLQEKGCKMEFRKVSGHKEQMNPNKFVDRLAVSGLRYLEVV